MAQITIDIDENEFKNISKEQLKKFVEQAVIDKVRRIKESESFREILSKSKATEKDVEALTDEIKEAVWKRHKAYHGNKPSS